MTSDSRGQARQEQSQRRGDSKVDGEYGNASGDSTTLEWAMAVLNRTQHATIVLDVNLSVIWASDSIESILGYNPKEATGHSMLEVIHPDDVGSLIERARASFAGGTVYSDSTRVVTADGTWEAMNIRVTDCRDDGLINGVVVSMQIDSETEADRELGRTRRYADTILSALTDSVVLLNDAGTVTNLNFSARKLFSIADGQSLSTLRPVDFQLFNADGTRLNPDEHPLVKGADFQPREMQVVTHNSLSWVHVEVRAVQSQDQHHGLVMTCHDITELRQAAERLREVAISDELTGLTNRYHLSEQLNLLSQRADDQVPNIESGSVAAVFIDLDGFKPVNDIYGHAVGDNLLRQVALRVKTVANNRGVLARYGGDEFVLIVNDDPQSAKATHIAEALLNKLAEPYRVQGQDLYLTASIGIAYDDGDDVDTDELLRQADIALYAAKRSGRNRYVVFDQQLAVEAEMLNDARSMVRFALEADRLEVWYQSILDNQGRVVGVEGLARINDETGRIRHPGEFLKAIEGSELLVLLDFAAFEISCAFARQLRETFGAQAPWVACNFSPSTITQSTFSEQVLRVISQSGVDPSQLAIEMTETTAFMAGEESIAGLRQLNTRGVAIALDDFGTGFSSLSHLRELPLNIVKIDQSFVADLGSVEIAIATAVADLAKTLGFRVVAEGVETNCQLDAVRSFGVELTQGWYHDRAQRPADLLQQLSVDEQGAVRLISQPQT